MKKLPDGFNMSSDGVIRWSEMIRDNHAELCAGIELNIVSWAKLDSKEVYHAGRDAGKMADISVRGAAESLVHLLREKADALEKWADDLRQI